jgi:hypothetical protein
VAVETTVNLSQYQTKSALVLAERAPGTYLVKMMIRGNSLLSSVYVKSISPGATLKVNYYDTTTGSDLTTERFELESHDLIDDTAAGKTFRISIPRIHNKPQAEVIVTGGTVEFGVYITVVDFVAADIDNALVREGDAFNPATSRALPVACYDTDTGTLHFVRCGDGGMAVSPPGNPWDSWARINSTPGVMASVISGAASATSTLRISQAGIVSAISGLWELVVGGAIRASGQTAPGKPDAVRKLEPAILVPSGATYEIRFKARAASPIALVDGHLAGYEIPN